MWSSDIEPEILPVGTRISERYMIVEPIAAGGMATVYLGHQRDLDREVAIKLMHPTLANYSSVRERFLREARVQAALAGDHVVTVHDIGLLEGYRPFIVMERVHGRDLRSILEQHGALSPRLAAEVVLQAALGLVEPHQASVVHRDIKPENLMVSRKGSSLHVTIIDFGVVKIPTRANPSVTQATGKQVGSPGYMAPEQFARPGTEDPRTDVWALGAVLYELLSGELAFNGDSLTEVCTKVVTGRRPRLSQVCATVPPALEAIVARCLMVDPRDRYEDAAALSRALQEYLARPVAPSPVEDEDDVDEQDDDNIAEDDEQDDVLEVDEQDVVAANRPLATARTRRRRAWPLLATAVLLGGALACADAAAFDSSALTERLEALLRAATH
jgi:serine/threonine-protein kinase